MKQGQNSKRGFYRTMINYVVGPVLFTWLSYSLYIQIKKQPGLGKAWDHIRQTDISALMLYAGSVILLMLVNWLIEAVKWKLVLKKVQAISLFKAFKAVLSGVSFSATTPNRVGEYAGRVLFLDEGNRLRSVSLTIVCSLSQLLITILMGCAGLLLLMNKISTVHLAGTGTGSLWVKLLLYGAVAALLVLALFYFRISLFGKLFEKLPWLNKHTYLVKEVEALETPLLLRLLLLSFVRFLVFCLQYYLVFQLFEINAGWWNTFLMMCVIFLVLAVIPTFAVAELGVRGTVTWEFMKIFTTNSLGVTITTASIWFINLIVPAIAGSILIAGVKLFRNKKEDQSSSSVKN
ncbi:MAG: lysylphosphatidylglycerol synthase transmembrane domain-containing protein [Chitinophagaceae bacterium]